MLCNDSYKLSIRHVEPVSKVDCTSKNGKLRSKDKVSVHDINTGGGGE